MRSLTCSPGWVQRAFNLLLLLVLRLELRFLLLLFHLRQADEILPRNQYKRGEHNGENGVLLVGHIRGVLSCASMWGGGRAHASSLAGMDPAQRPAEILD